MKSYDETSPMAKAMIGAEIDGLAAKIAWCIDYYRWAKRTQEDTTPAIAALEVFGVSSISVNEMQAEEIGSEEIMCRLRNLIHSWVWGNEPTGNIADLEHAGVWLRYSHNINALLADIRQWAEK